MTKENIINVFNKAGNLLYCDKIRVFDFKNNAGECRLFYSKEKHIMFYDDLFKDMEKNRLYDMLRMGFDDTIGWVSLECKGVKYEKDYDVIIIPFELGEATNQN